MGVMLDFSACPSACEVVGIYEVVGILGGTVKIGARRGSGTGAGLGCPVGALTGVNELEEISNDASLLLGSGVLW